MVDHDFVYIDKEMHNNACLVRFLDAVDDKVIVTCYMENISDWVKLFIIFIKEEIEICPNEFSEENSLQGISSMYIRAIDFTLPTKTDTPCVNLYCEVI